MIQKKKSNIQQPKECGFDNHDFFQIGEPSAYVPSAALGGSLGAMPRLVNPRFICRKCGKVIQL